MSNCNSCSSKEGCNKEECSLKGNPLNDVKKIIGVMSGKGGVGKSTLSVLIAKKLKEKGYKVGIMDADITGPSVPRLLNVDNKRAEANELGILPVETKEGIKVISLNLLIESENDPVIWRGPLIAGVVQQFWTDVIWGELDYLIIDMPPGTGDVALTVMQSIPITGLVMVSVPQDMVSMIVSKAVIMAKKMNQKVLGVIENMSYIICPDCEHEIKLFDNENTEKFLQELKLPLLGELPMSGDITNISKDASKKLSDEIDIKIDSITNKIIEVSK